MGDELDQELRDRVTRLEEGAKHANEAIDRLDDTVQAGFKTAALERQAVAAVDAAKYGEIRASLAAIESYFAVGRWGARAIWAVATLGILAFGQQILSGIGLWISKILR
jgi:hypothetical protein